MMVACHTSDAETLAHIPIAFRPYHYASIFGGLRAGKPKFLSFLFFFLAYYYLLGTNVPMYYYNNPSVVLLSSNPFPMTRYVLVKGVGAQSTLSARAYFAILHQFDCESFNADATLVSASA